MKLSLSGRTLCGTGRCPCCVSRAAACRPAVSRAPALRALAYKQGEAAAAASGAATHKKGHKFHGWGVPTKGAKLEPIAYEPAPLGPDDIDIKVTHNGLCHTDIHMRDDDWGASGFPFIPGHEVVGEVVALGDNVKKFKLGDVVGVGWIKSSCGGCLHCLRGEENICVKGYTGLITVGGMGGFQPVMRTTATFAYSIPKGLDRAAAAPLLCAGVTVYSPLRKHITRPGMQVAVVGIGGLGHLGLQFARAMGAIVTALDVAPEKEAEAKEFGAHSFVRLGTGAKPPVKFDVILNCASGKLDFASLLGMLETDGTMVQVGIPGGGALITLPLQDVVFNQKKLAGSIVGGRADMQEMLDFAAATGVKPKVELMPLSKVNEAMDRVQAGKARYRVVLETDEASSIKALSAKK